MGNSLEAVVKRNIQKPLNVLPGIYLIVHGISKVFLSNVEKCGRSSFSYKSNYLLGIASKFRFLYEVILNELINFYSPWNYHKTSGFKMISVGIEVS